MNYSQVLVAGYYESIQIRNVSIRFHWIFNFTPSTSFDFIEECMKMSNYRSIMSDPYCRLSWAWRKECVIVVQIQSIQVNSTIARENLRLRVSRSLGFVLKTTEIIGNMPCNNTQWQSSSKVDWGTEFFYRTNDMRLIVYIYIYVTISFSSEIRII